MMFIWMKEVHGHNSQGEVIRRILPQFAVEGWDKHTY